MKPTRCFWAGNVCLLAGLVMVYRDYTCAVVLTAAGVALTLVGGYPRVD